MASSLFHGARVRRMSDSDQRPQIDPRLKGRERVLAQIEVWRKELVNLARSNRLLHYRETRASTLGIVAEEDEVASIVERTLRGERWTFFVPPDADEAENDEELLNTGFHAPAPEGFLPGPRELLTDKVDARSLTRTLQNLDRRANQEYMDKGLWILYLAAGLLRWIDPDTKDEVRSPLLLIPISLHRENPREPYRLTRGEEDIVVNPALALKLGEFGIELPVPEDPDEPQLEPFLNDVEGAVRTRPGWSVERRLVISHFSFHKEVMYRDLEAHAEEIADHPLIRALVLGSEEGAATDFEPLGEEELDDHGLPDHGATVLPADGTQRQCIDAGVRGESFVMDGPPGTGKSQTIANMIAENIAAGRNVLFVSEKAAALEVVEKRLEEVGLGDYTLELHSHKATRKEVAHELARALSMHPQGRAGIPPADLATLATRRAELSRRAAAINEVREPLGRSLHFVLGRIAQLQDVRPAPHPESLGRSLSAAEFSEVTLETNRLSRAWGPVERGEGFLWRELGGIRLDAGTQRRIGDEIETASIALERLVATGRELAAELGLPPATELPDLQRLLLVLRHLEGRPVIPVAWLTASALAPIRDLVQTRRDQVGQIVEAVSSMSSQAGPRFRELPVHAEAEVAESLARLEQSPLGADVRQLDHTRITRLRNALDTSVTFLRKVRDDAIAIAEGFALPTSRLSYARALELAALGSLASATGRPEASWLTPAGLASAREASQALRPLVESLRDQHNDLGQFFSDDVLDLDLDGLITRFESVHQGLGKLRGAYRDDKRTLAQVSKTGKASRDLVELLPRAREWQQQARAVEVAEKRYADVLAIYYEREATDFDRIESAIGVASEAHGLAGPSLSVDGLQQQLARTAAPTAAVQLAASAISHEAAAWDATADELLGGSLANFIRSSDLEEAIALLVGIKESVDSFEAAHAFAETTAGRDFTAEELVQLLGLRSSLDEAESGLNMSLAADQEALGDSYRGVDTDWDDLTGRLDWAFELRDLLGRGIDEEAAQRLTSSALEPDELARLLDTWTTARDAVASNFADGRKQEIQRDLMTTPDDAHALLGDLATSVGDIEEWFEYAGARARMVDLGLEPTIAFCESERVPRDKLAEVVERAVLEAWADDVIEQDKERIGSVRADQLENVVDEFRELDQRVIDLAAARVIKAANDRRPRTTLGPAGVIQREGQKQRKHMPIRSLLETAGSVAQALKPCFMMTPLTVSQFLPPSFRFDVVIFDEASQVRPSDAINCIYRGDQLIVAGDEQQLPPTSFFEASMGDDSDEWEEDQFDEFESILKLCLGAGALRQLPLRWHYRSQHEDLIVYSNHSFYDGRLISFPGAIHESPETGVAFIHAVGGVYRRGTARDNPVEARFVADRVMHWAEWSVAHPDREVTIGVVAFSEAQASAIELELNTRRQERPDLDHYFREDRLDGYFIKNLENVQGDERDVMIFSVGYGRDENGKFTMNFGPLNRSGGKRRLNVAVTRARRRVEVVSSVRAEEFAGDLTNEGVRHLQRYLDFAARGYPALALEIGDTQLDAESPFEEEVLRVVRSWGFDAVPQVGSAGYRVDIGVRHPTETGRYALGIECDGAMYHSSRAARDRDRLRQEVLEGLGWQLHRIWGTSWYRDRSRQEEALKSAIEKATSSVGPPLVKRLPDPPEWVDEEYEYVAPDEVPAWADVYAVAALERPSTWAEMHDPVAQAEFRRLITQVVNAEGPVSREVVLRRVREAWGVQRAGSRIREAYGLALSWLTSRGVVLVQDTDFLIAPGAEPASVRVPSQDIDDTRRRVDEIPPRELRAAIEHVVRDAMQVERGELTQAVARLYGWNRRGSDIGPALERAVTYLLRAKRLEKNGSYLQIPARGTALPSKPGSGA